jgi:hypothetical protein
VSPAPGSRFAPRTCLSGSPPRRSRSSSCSVSSTSMSRCGGIKPTKRPSPSTTARALSPRRAVSHAAISWSVPGATEGGEGSIRSDTGVPAGAEKRSSILRTPASLPSSKTATCVMVSYPPPSRARRISPAEDEGDATGTRLETCSAATSNSKVASGEVPSLITAIPSAREAHPRRRAWRPRPPS